ARRGACHYGTKRQLRLPARVWIARVWICREMARNENAQQEGRTPKPPSDGLAKICGGPEGVSRSCRAEIAKRSYRAPRARQALHPKARSRAICLKGYAIDRGMSTGFP